MPFEGEKFTAVLFFFLAFAAAYEKRTHASTDDFSTETEKC